MTTQVKGLAAKFSKLLQENQRTQLDLQNKIKEKIKRQVKILE